jgi:multimeric flavodoxin WrbA
MMVMAVNGSTRKTWNTATFLAEALKGATSQGAATDTDDVKSRKELPASIGTGTHGKPETIRNQT